MSENEYTDKDGVTYEALNSYKFSGCSGCVHESTYSTSGPTEGCKSSAECRRRLRSDRRNIIWAVKK